MSDSIPFPLEKTLFIDIETAPLWRSLSAIPAAPHEQEGNILKDYWEQRYGKERSENQTSDEYFLDKAAIHAPFARVVCIGLGWIGLYQNNWTWRETILYNLDEKQLLSDFIDIWTKFIHKRHISVEASILCGHNIINFDYVFLGRRMILNGVSLPPPWQSSLYQPYWNLQEVRLVDTMRLWNLGDPKRSDFISLEVLARIINIPFRKSLSHHDIRDSFFKWEDTGDEGHFRPVLAYCAEDVRTVAKIYLHLIGRQDLIPYIQPPQINS